MGREARLAELVGFAGRADFVNQGAPVSQQELAEAVLRWLRGNKIGELDVTALEELLKSIDEFYFDAVLDEIAKLEPNRAEEASSDSFSRTHGGLEGLNKAELDFFEIAAASGARNVCLYNDMPLLETTLDPNIANVYRKPIGNLVRMGTHFTIVHTVDRPLVETVIVLRLWLPLFLSGAATPFYIAGASDRLFSHETYVCEIAALSAEGVMGHQEDGRCYLTTKPDDVAYYQQKMKFILEHASTLLEIYRDDDPAQRKAFSELREAHNREGDGRIVGADKYDNLHIVSYSGDCATVTIERDPAIHLVIRHPQLCYVISHMM